MRIVVNTVVLLGCVLLCFSAGWIGNSLGMPGENGWYDSLQKPAWQPPGIAFPVVWSALYLLMGIALWLVWLRVGIDGVAVPLFGGQLAFNAMWSGFFFGLQEPLAALVVLILLWVLLVFTVRAFWAVRPAAGAIMLPYLIWVSFAGVLNFEIWRLNG